MTPDRLEQVLAELDALQGEGPSDDTAKLEFSLKLRQHWPLFRAKLRAAMEMEKVVAKVIIAGCCFEYEEFGTCHCVFRRDIEEAEQALAAWQQAGEEANDGT